MTIRDLETAALEAHKAGVTFTQFWPTVAEAVGELEPWNRRAFHRLHDRLRHICITGSEDGMFAVGDPDAPCPWVADDAADNLEMRQLFGEVD